MSISTVAVIGAGTMGHGIAQVSAMAGMQTRLYDLNQEAADAGYSRIVKNLETFDTLDFEVFSGQQWDRLHESHAEDIVVHWPDGRTVQGLDAHIDDLSAFFVFAPDTTIDKHPIRIGQGEWTGVVGEITGTFSEPMPIGNGQFIEPTGKRYTLTMATIGHWTDAGVMDEEYLFWDNHAFYQQIGLIE